MIVLYNSNFFIKISKIIMNFKDNIRLTLEQKQDIIQYGSNQCIEIREAWCEVSTKAKENCWKKTQITPNDDEYDIVYIYLH